MSKDTEFGTPEQVMNKLNALRADLFKRRIDDLAKIYGSWRAVGHALNIDQAYLHRLASGEKRNPGKVVLRKLGLGV